MDVKPGYKLTEVGVIPEEWEVKSLNALADKIMVGIASAATHAYRNRGIVMFRNQNIKPGYLDDSDVLYIDEIYEETYRNKRLKAGDLLTARTGYPGTTCIVPSQHEGAQSFTTLITRPNRKLIDSEYLSCFINSEAGQKYFEQHQIGGGQKNVNAGSLKCLKVPVPPTKAEQEAIAEALSDTDALIESLEQIVAKKRQIKQGAMQELLTGKRRLPGFSGEWEATTFGNVVHHHAGNSTLIKGKLQASQASGLYPGFSASGQDVWCNHYEHEGDAVVVSAVGSRCGKAFPASGRWCAIANTHVVWPNENKVDRHFLSHFINDEDFWLKSGSGQPFVLFKQSFAQLLLLPSLPEQTAIATILSDLDAELSALEDKLAKARQLKQGMMQELLTGRIRLV